MSEETAVATIESAPLAISPEVMEQVLVGGDLAKLSPAARNDYYLAVCRSVGLNPLTKPFEYLQLNGKLRLYALRDCTDQLRRLQKISIEITKRERLDDLYIVTARAFTAEGRVDESTGAVTVKGQSGENLANALMKAETKAKRRATLSIAGMGWLDESEMDAIPQAAMPAPVERPKAVTSGQAKAQETDARQRETLLGAIETALRDAGVDRPTMQQHLFQAFATAGWSKIKVLPIAELEAGYAKLKFALQQADVPDFTPHVGEVAGASLSTASPSSSAIAESAPGETIVKGELSTPSPEGEPSTEGEPGTPDDDARASDAQVAELKLLAQQVGQDAQDDLEGMIGGKRRASFTMGTYRTVKKYLLGRKDTAAQGALV